MPKNCTVNVFKFLIFVAIFSLAASCDFLNKYDGKTPQLSTGKSQVCAGLGGGFQIVLVRSEGTNIIVPRLFEEKRRDIVFGFPSFRPSVLPSFRPPIGVCTLCKQLLLQFYSDSFETLQMS